MVYDYLINFTSHYTQLRLFSDNCKGQNKNHTLTRFLIELTDMKELCFFTTTLWKSWQHLQSPWTYHCYQGKLNVTELDTYKLFELKTWFLLENDNIWRNCIKRQVFFNVNAIHMWFTVVARHFINSIVVHTYSLNQPWTSEIYSMRLIIHHETLVWNRNLKGHTEQNSCEEDDCKLF